MSINQKSHSLINENNLKSINEGSDFLNNNPQFPTHLDTKDINFGKKTMAFDVDGVLLNFTNEFDNAASNFLGKIVNPSENSYGQKQYDIAKRAECTYEDVDKILKHMLDTLQYSKFKPLPGVAESLEKIKDEGFKRIIITALPESASDMRLKNLKNSLGFVPDDCYFVGMGKSKNEALLKSNPDVFIDDRVKYLREGAHVFHLVWCDQNEIQDDREFMVSARVKSLSEWTDKHLQRISKQLDLRYNYNLPIQKEFNFKNDLRYRPS